MIEPRNRPRAVLLALRSALGGIVLFSALLLSRAEADEIRFRAGGGVQAGTVLEEGGGTVTIRFPRESIESITQTVGKHEEEPKREPVPGLEERVRELEKKVGSLPPAGSPAEGREKTGDVEGVIRWKGRPLPHGRVMIVPEQYAGMSPEPPKNARPGIQGAPGGGPGRSFETETDADGRYRLERVPPGAYLLYWMPDSETGWVRRLRDKPDIEVLPGSVTVQNVPAERK